MARSNLELPRWPAEWLADAPDAMPSANPTVTENASLGIAGGLVSPAWTLESSGLSIIMDPRAIADINFSGVDDAGQAGKKIGLQGHMPAGYPGHLQFVDAAGHGYFEDSQTARRGFQEFSYPTLQQHYKRNTQNYPPKTAAEAGAAGWKEAPDWQNRYHRNGPGAESNVKYISRDGHQEGVYNKSGQLVNSIENEGTYNFESPKRDPVGHFRDDMIPYWLYGNGPKDTTPWYKRVFGN